MREGWDLASRSGKAALWDRTMGFFDHDLEETMALQHRLLMEQLGTLQRGELGRSLIGVTPHASYEEFRERVPLTSYDDYALTLGERLATVLPDDPEYWIRTSGRSGGKQKWVPVSREWNAANRWRWLGVVIASLARDRGHVALEGDERVLNMTAPPPYGSGALFKGTEDLWPFRMLPPTTPEYLGMGFEQRMGTAFSMAVTYGIDIVASQGSVLANVGETFAERRPPGSILSRLKNPRGFARMGRAALRAKTAGHPIYPRDAWNVRATITGGMDTTLFREPIRRYWGVLPLELLASTEGTLVAFQSWNRNAMTLVPDLNFFEFLAEDLLEADEQEARNRTVLLDGVEPGRNYELILTNFHGGSMVRYRTGDVLRVTALEDSAAGVRLPQVMHYTRRSDVIGIAGIVNLTEQTIWRAIEVAEVPYVDWTARKEIEGEEPVLALRIEPRPNSHVAAAEAQARIDRVLADLDPDWAEMETLTGLRPLRVTYLGPHAFDRYRSIKIAAGADLGQLKPQHVNAPDEAITALEEAATIAAAREREPVR
jgi:hypothetical protein